MFTAYPDEQRIVIVALDEHDRDHNPAAELAQVRPGLATIGRRRSDKPPRCEEADQPPAMNEELRDLLEALPEQVLSLSRESASVEVDRRTARGVLCPLRPKLARGSSYHGPGFRESWQADLFRSLFQPATRANPAGAPVAQHGESADLHKLEVAGSNPARGTARGWAE